MNRAKPQAPAKSIEWSIDPVVRRYQEFAWGYDEDEEDTRTFIDFVFFSTPWIKQASDSLLQAMALPAAARAEHWTSMSGETRAGKTAFQRYMIRKHPPSRGKTSLHIPIARLDMPSTPSPSALDYSILRALGDPTAGVNRNDTKRLWRIQEVAEQVGLKSLLLDNVQHVVDARGERVQHQVVDRMKEIGDLIRCPFGLSGLPRMAQIFVVNAQGAGRSETTIEFRRLNWGDPEDRGRFREMVKMAIEVFECRVGKSEFDYKNEVELFRLFISVGGLVGFLVRVLRRAATVCSSSGKPLSRDILRGAVSRVIAHQSAWPNGYDPFHESFVAKRNTETLKLARLVGTGEGPAPVRRAG